MSFYQQELRKEIKAYDFTIEQIRTQIQETEIELRNETDVFEKIRLMNRLRILRNTKNILKNILKLHWDESINISDTKTQIKNTKNQYHISYLKILYIRRKSIIEEIKYVEKLKEKEIYVGFIKYVYIDIKDY